VNTAWTIGFVVGIMVAAILCMVVMKRATQKKGASAQYDERQQAARGKAFTAAYATILVYLAAWMVFRSLEVPFFMESLSVILGALLSIGVFVGYSIFHDAYFKCSDSPRAWLMLMGGIALMNTGIGVGKLIGAGTIRERLYDNVNLFMGALFVGVLACVVIKRALDRKGEVE